MRRDLRRLLPDDRTGGLATHALHLARLLDAGAIEAAMQKEFRATLLELLKRQEPAAVADPVDELAERRRRRRGA